MKLDDVVVTGIGIASHLGADIDAIGRAVAAQQSQFRRIDLFDVTGCPVQFGGQISNLDTLTLPNRKIQKLVTRKDLLGIAAAYQASINAGITLPVADAVRAGTFVGSASTQVGDLIPYFIVGASCISADMKRFDSAAFGENCLGEINPTFALKVLMNSCLAHISQTLNLQGANANFIEYETSGLRALEAGHQAITTGLCDMVVAGAVCSPFDPFQIANHWHLGRIADQQDCSVAPSVVPHRGNGTVLSEASVFFVLERAAHARERRATQIYATLDHVGDCVAAADIFYEDAVGVTIEDEAERHALTMHPQLCDATLHNIAPVTGDVGECRGLFALACAMANGPLQQSVAVTAKNRFNQRLFARLSRPT